MSFVWPQLFVLLLLIVPLSVIGYRRLQKRRADQLAKLGAFGIRPNSATDPNQSSTDKRRLLIPILYLLSLALLLFGLTRPEATVTLPRVEGTVILAFDISSSMLADDLEPTRMDAAKAAARAFAENQPSTVKIGVVAFSNGGLIVLPPTNVTADVLAAIDRLTPQGGTSLGAGMLTSLNAVTGEVLVIDPEQLAAARQEGSEPFGLDTYPGSVVVLLSDGENTGPPEPLDVAQVSAEAAVRVYTIGIGSSDGTVIEVDGFSVVTRLNEEPLQQIAELTNGQYFYAQDADALREIYESIDLQMTVRGEKMEITALFAALATLLMIAAAALSLFWYGRIA